MYVSPKPLQPTKIIAGCIAVFENAWENPKKTIEEIEKYASQENVEVPFVDATVITDNGKMVDSSRSNKHLALTRSARVDETMRQINNRFLDLVCAGSDSYRTLMGINEDLFIGEGFNILRYQTGQEYKAHYDGGTKTKRSVSPILYLNDEYTGGEIEFVNFDVKIKPNPGTFLIFPANFAYTHIAHPVKDGTKYAIVTWLFDQQP